MNKQSLECLTRTVELLGKAFNHEFQTILNQCFMSGMNIPQANRVAQDETKLLRELIHSMPSYKMYMKERFNWEK